MVNRCRKRSQVMETILVLTDFSDTSLHAAKYALHLAERFDTRRLLVVNTYRILAPATDIPLDPETGEDLRQASLRSLHTFQNMLGPAIQVPPITIQLISMEADLIEAVNEISVSEKVDLIVMGMTGKSGVINTLMGSNSSRLLKGCNLPLLIVPKDAPIELPKLVALATDLKEVKGKVSSDAFTHFLDILHPALFVVNVADSEESYDPETQKGISNLHELLDSYGARYYYINAVDIVDGINAFVREHHISLIIAIHEMHTGLAGIFHKSVSKKLASRIEVPLMILPHNK